MSPHRNSSAKQRNDSSFDISRSSFFQFLKEERDEIRRLHADECARAGEEVDIHAALHTWFQRRRWEWADRKSRS
ncbi:hypothetical protein [Cerasicoccus frondis]|uniref:hypothetical protein n=1 Tax=Cerasicoccus frondis TaxID=490090 RepID=UPI002852AA08|nr:hypothetical protein [Cerasicoccus frondis]